MVRCQAPFPAPAHAAQPRLHHRALLAPLEGLGDVPQRAPGGADVSSWKVTTKHGTQSGVGVSVSGAGAWAQMEGTMTFHILHLDDSKTYQKMKETYDIGGGIGGFFSWLGLGANADTHKTEIHSVFNEIKNQQYQHNGKGTIIFKKKGIIMQRTRKIFNNDKIISS